MNKMLKHGLAGIVLSAGLSASVATGCTALENAFLDSDMGKQAIVQVEYKLTKNEDGYKIDDFGFFDSIDKSPEKPILLYIHGWGGSSRDLFEEEKNEKESRMSIMKDVFGNRVLVANYPCDTGIDGIFSNLEKPFRNFVNKYIHINKKSPEFIIAGHSMGTQISRLFARKYGKMDSPDFPEGYSPKIKKLGLIAGINGGVDFGIFTGFVKSAFPKHIKKILAFGSKPVTEDSYRTVNDMLKESDFMKKLESPAGPLDIEYNFYAFSSYWDNIIIPEYDDKVTPLEAAYPYNLIKKGKFEKVKFGDVIIFTGDVDHLSTQNMFIFRKIMESLSSEKIHSYTPVEPEKAMEI